MSGDFEIGGQPAGIRDALDRWLQAFGRAWQAGDADAIAALFHADGVFFETPFGPPVKGVAAIRDHWAAMLAEQGNVVFMYRVMAAETDLGIARWAAQFDLRPAGKRIEYDGILEYRHHPDGSARILRMWWHNREAPQRRPNA